MRLPLAPLALLFLLAAGCGGSSGSTSATAPTTAPATTTQTTTASEASVRVYFLRDGKVAPVRVRIEPTQAVATAAVNALLAGPPSGYDTAIPEGGRLESLTIEAGVATATLSDQLRGLDDAAEAQLVYTLTQFPTVAGVRTLPQPLNGEEGVDLAGPATRADYEGETPALLVESPLPHDEVTSPIHARGTANAFEATFQMELRRGGEVLVHRTVMATSGSGERGTFEVELPYTGSGEATLVAWEDSAASPPEGPPILHEVRIPLVLG